MPPKGTVLPLHHRANYLSVYEAFTPKLHIGCTIFGGVKTRTGLKDAERETVGQVDLHDQEWPIWA